MVMTLVIRWPLVPAEHVLSSDFRPLGLFVRTIRFASPEAHQTLSPPWDPTET